MILLPELPYANDALEPLISSRTLDFHYGKHHNTYVANLNKLIEGTEFSQETLESIIKNTSGRDDKTAVFNNAAQVWNHIFYWHSIKPAGGGIPYGPLAEKIDIDFGSYEVFARKFKDTALSQFGSGWAWLVQKDGKLEIIKTSNADTPIAKEVKPLLTVDVWEHGVLLKKDTTFRR